MVEPFVRKQEIRHEKTDRLVEMIERIKTEARDDEDGVLDIWEAEGLHTLSLFVERTDDADYLVWYIEADDVDQLIEARAESTHPLHDVEDELMAETLESPENVGDFELLLHGVNPNRPATFQIE